MMFKKKIEKSLVEVAFSGDFFVWEFLEKTVEKIGRIQEFCLKFDEKKKDM